jgi:cytochrome c oxidase cbb3-type subunit I
VSSTGAAVSGTDRAVLERVGWRGDVDGSCQVPVGLFFVSAIAWLMVGTVLALLASLKMHVPGFLDGTDWLTFGRVRPAHLNTMIYGWGSMAGVGVMLWLEARLCRVRLPLQLLLVVGVVLWNVGVAGGTIGILTGAQTGVEWLEFPYPWSFLFAGVFAVVMAASLMMFSGRREGHIYVSQWYLFGAVLWFPFLYVMANALIHGNLATGVVQASANWWFAHNVLGLWFTPIGLAAVYYLLPKVLGRPIHSYYLSLLGFWTLALFYNWAGTHHLIGGPLPAWLITVGVVGSLMMFIPVTTVAINHHLTTVGHFSRLRVSPTLRFVVFGAMSYTVVSFQGSLQSLRSVNEVNHFTHYTIAHAHLGVYSFFTMVMFGAIYYIAPRLTGREWASARLIKVHFWGTATGMAIYWIGLTWGGWIQGLKMDDPDVPFLDIVRYTVPFLASRTAAGVLMTIGHIAFAVLAWKMFAGSGVRLVGPTLFTSRRPAAIPGGEV